MSPWEVSAVTTLLVAYRDLREQCAEIVAEIGDDEDGQLSFIADRLREEDPDSRAELELDVERVVATIEAAFAAERKCRHQCDACKIDLAVFVCADCAAPPVATVAGDDAFPF